MHSFHIESNGNNSLFTSPSKCLGPPACLYYSITFIEETATLHCNSVNKTFSYAAAMHATIMMFPWIKVTQIDSLTPRHIKIFSSAYVKNKLFFFL
uniref:Predicted protein n=1 Tax=Hordeum vulgare subsp. vulgare TaxID=112509 RepID=F2DMQ0_HORVV|nr:predicted protein [Hordeum vulgare subsp. vulgare]